MIKVTRGSTAGYEKLYSYQEAINLPAGTPFQATGFSPNLDAFLISRGSGKVPLFVLFNDVSNHDGSFNKSQYRFRILPPVTITFSGDSK